VGGTSIPLSGTGGAGAAGGSGGDGVIALSYRSLTGTTTPAAYQQQRP
jgi:hypothetical protein